MGIVDRLLRRKLMQLIEREGGGAGAATVSKAGHIHLRDVTFSCPALEATLEEQLGGHLPLSLHLVTCGTIDIVLPLGQWSKGTIEASGASCLRPSRGRVARSLTHVAS